MPEGRCLSDERCVLAEGCVLEEGRALGLLMMMLLLGCDRGSCGRRSTAARDEGANRDGYRASPRRRRSSSRILAQIGKALGCTEQSLVCTSCGLRERFAPDRVAARFCASRRCRTPGAPGCSEL